MGLCCLQPKSSKKHSQNFQNSRCLHFLPCYLPDWLCLAAPPTSPQKHSHGFTSQTPVGRHPSAEPPLLPFLGFLKISRYRQSLAQSATQHGPCQWPHLSWLPVPSALSALAYEILPPATEHLHRLFPLPGILFPHQVNDGSSFWSQLYYFLQEAVPDNAAPVMTLSTSPYVLVTVDIL